MSETSGNTILVIGGGAAGFFGAIACAEADPTARVVILERGPEVLGKVRISGGGRCNVTHACFEPKELVRFYPRGEKALLGPFHRFCSGDTVEWYESRGVPLKIEADGRMFPVSDRSQSIIDCLENAARQAGVEVRTRQKVVQMYPPEEPGQDWKVMTAGGDAFFAKAILVAAGSSAAVWDLLRHLGHTVVPPVPSLFTFNIADPRIDGLAGLVAPNARVQIAGTKWSADGPVLVTHWGLSGPGILKLSAWAARELHERSYRFEIEVNWWGNTETEDIRQQFLRSRQEQARKLVRNANPSPLPQRLWERLTIAAGIGDQQRWADLGNRQLQELAEQNGRCLFSVGGKSTFKEEFVTAGGVALDEVDFKTFESKIHRGLFLAGEVLDIDAVTGGFNFQAAWTGGWIAGKAMAG